MTVQIPITNELKRAAGVYAPEIEKELSKFHRWMITKGKVPEREKPLSEAASKNYHDRIDQLFRFVIDRFDPSDPTIITHEQADLLLKYLDRDKIVKRSGDGYSESAKRKYSNTLSKYFEWRRRIGKHDETWEPKLKFSSASHESADKLSFKERWLIREAAKDYGKLPDYYNSGPEDRDRINALVAERLGKPKKDITRNDWEMADESLKVGSLVAVGLDTGVTPVEVSNFSVHWVYPKRNVIEIPEKHASKERKTSTLPITEDTADLLSRWMKERRHYSQYDGSDLLWLTNKGTPYTSANLCRLTRTLCEKANIPIENRKIVWYSLRHNVGNLLEEAGSLSEAGDQLRHRRYETTKNTYNETAINRRRYRLNQINELARRSVEDPNFEPYEEIEMGLHRYSPSRPNNPGHPDDGKIHIDSVIEDTKEARVDLVRSVLNESDR